MDLKNIGRNIRNARNGKSLTQAELSAMAGFSVNHISRIETGTGTMSLDSLIAIANALETTPDYILMGEYNITADRAAMVLSEKIERLTQDEIAYILEAADLFLQLKVNRK
jgi:transcriptional regulator with XRE-family HTH domain